MSITTTHPGDQAIDDLSRLVGARFGLRLAADRHAFVRTRLRRLVRQWGMRSADDLAAAVLAEGSEPRLLAVFDALSTNVTSLFRDPAHFDCLRDEVYEPIRRGVRPAQLNIWSAACSTGAEPCSLAIQACEELGIDGARGVHVHASDLCESALRVARRGVLSSQALSSISAERMMRHFLRGTGRCDGYCKVAEHVSRLVSFHRINLVESWPWVAKFDVIFCRNVMIYFDKCVREQVVERLRDALLPGGILVLGSSESLSDLNIGGMRMLQASVYRREAA